MQIGSIIKSFDFPGDVDCYMIGQITAVEGDFLICRTLRQVFDSAAVESPAEEFRTPKQGMCMFDEKFERVVLVG